MDTNYTHHVPPPCDEVVEVVYDDEHILVVSKPSGLLSVPGRFVKDCVLSRMLYEFPDARIVHRLDLDTSGLLVLALSQVATSNLNRQFREKNIAKRYEALLDGLVAHDEGEIDLPIRPDPDNRPKQIVDIEQGKAALTRYRVKQRMDETTRVELIPVTGKSHQLRIHTAEIGHPILGCDLYACEDALRKAERLCLHAAELSLDHPATSERLTFTSDVPF